MNTALAQSFILAMAIGLASGAVGAFVILRRMALVGDALSHVALPGIALALALRLDPFWGALVFLLLAALIVWRLEKMVTLPTEALVGILFTASLAAGILGVPHDEILDSLFGAFVPRGGFEFSILVLVTLAALGAAFFLSRRIIFSIVAEEIAALRDRRRLTELLFLLLFSLVVALGIKLVGTLLMGALAIIPAAIAKQTTRRMTTYVISSALWGAGISALGVLLASYFSFAPGPVIILIGVVAFVGVLLFSQS